MNPDLNTPSNTLTPSQVCAGLLDARGDRARAGGGRGSAAERPAREAIHDLSFNPQSKDHEP
jgi:hypothetical protein